MIHIGLITKTTWLDLENLISTEHKVLLRLKGMLLVLQVFGHKPSFGQTEGVT